MGKNEQATPRARQELRASGVSRRALAGAQWESPHRGVHRSESVNDAVRQRILDASAIMPAGGAIGGWAAAYLHGVSHLDGKNRKSGADDAVLEPVLLVVPGRFQVRRSGIATLRAELGPDDVVTRHTLRCTSGPRTAYDLLRLAPDLTAAVVAGDAVLRAGLVDEPAMLEYALRHRGVRGLCQLRAAVDLLDPAAASPPESRLRMLCHLQTDLPALLVNVPVYDLSGTFLGKPDLLEPVSGLSIEYDGEYHRELTQHTADNLREESLEAAGLAVVRVTSLDLQDEEAVAERISRAYERRLTRDLGQDAWTVAHRPAAA